MKIIKFKCKENELREKLLPQLVGSVFHVTDSEGYKGILTSETIESNKGPFRHGQSRKNYGTKRGYICLVDLRGYRDSDPKIRDALTRFYFLNPNDKAKVYFFVLKPSLYSEVIPWKKAKSEVGNKEVWVPYIEGWYPKTIMLKDIEKVFDVELSPNQIIDNGSYVVKIMMNHQKNKFKEVAL